MPRGSRRQNRNDLIYADSREREYQRELCLFNEISLITAQTLDLQEIVDLVLETTLDFFRIEAGLLLLWDGEQRRLSCVAARGFAPQYLHQLTVGQLENIIGPYLAMATQPLIIEDIYADVRLETSTFSEAIRHEGRFRAVLSIPLTYREEITGFLNLAAVEAGAFLPACQSFYYTLGNQIGLAIANAKLYHDLRQSEMRYRRIFERSKDMIFICDQEGRLLDLNPAGLELLGFTDKAEALAHLSLRDIFCDPLDWELFKERVARDGYAKDLEVTLKQRRGSVVPVLLTGIGGPCEDGGITGYEGIVKDITEIKRSALELLREKKTTEGILEGLPVATFVIDSSHRVIYWNRACELLTGYSRQEVVGTFSYWLPFYSHEGPSMASLVVEQNIDGLERFFGDKNLKRSPHSPVAFEAYEYYPDFRGEEKYFYNTCSPIYDETGQIQGAVQAIVDVTEREQLSNHLKESEEKFRSLVENSLDGIVLHHNLKLLYVNRAALEMFGYQQPQEMLGDSILNYIELPYQQTTSRKLSQILRGVSRPRTFEMKGIRKDGRRFDLEVISFPTQYEGQPASQTHLRDITLKKHLDEHLARTEKLAALGQLAAGVAHEMNNPLGSILVYSYLLLEDLEAGRAEKAQAEKIIREATRCKEIVQGLLEFSRYMPSQMVPLSLNALLEEVLSLVEDHLLFQYIKVEKDFCPELPLVLGDKSKLEQVLINLLINSGEAMAGEGTLIITTALAGGGDLVRVSFQDTGPGIPAHNLSRLFDPFFTTKEVGQGVGLGLSISYGIIQKHMGRIFVEKTGPQGTTFVIELPVYQPEQKEEAGSGKMKKSTSQDLRRAANRVD